MTFRTHIVANNYSQFQFQEIRCPFLTSRGTKHVCDIHTYM